MLLDANLQLKYWGEAIATATYLQNRLPSRAIERTPYELWTGQKPSYDGLRIFGCEAYVHLPEVKRTKLETKAQKLIFVGYSEEHKGYRFLDCETNKIIISRDVSFIELESCSGQTIKAEDTSKSPTGEDEIEISSIKSTEQNANEENHHEEQHGITLDNSTYYDLDDELSDNAPEVQPDLNRRDRHNRGILPKRFNDFR